MPFDVNKLLQDPAFGLGASILGNTGQPGVVGNALMNMQRINDLKRQRELDTQHMGIEQDRNNMERERTAAQTENYKSEAKLREAQMAQELRKQRMQENFFKALAPSFGVDPSMFADPGGDPTQQPQAPQQNPAQPPQQPQNGPIPGTTMGPVPPASMPGGMRPRALVPLVPMLPGHAHIEGIQPAEDKKFQGMTSRYMNRTGAGIPPEIMDGIERTESGGNPNAINPQSGAQGAYQFMPQTVDMLRKQGVNFDPFNKQQSRNAAEFYLTQLADKRGGDLRAALADYGGFKTKDPSSYIARVMGGATSPPARESGAQAQPMANPGLQMAGLGALGGMMGIPGAAGLIQYGQMQKPENVPAGSYQRDPRTGETNFVGDPYREQGLANDQQRIGLEGQRVANDTRKTDVEIGKLGSEAQQQALKMQQSKAQGIQSYRAISQNLDMLDKTVGTLLNHPGLERNTGWQGALGLGKVPGTEGHDAQVKLDQLKSQQMIEVLKALKSESANGGSGFGQLSEREGDTLRGYIANLDKAQTLPSMKQALKDIQDWTKQSRSNFTEQFQNVYGSSPAPQQQQQAPAGLPAGWKRIQ